MRQPERSQTTHPTVRSHTSAWAPGTRRDWAADQQGSQTPPPPGVDQPCHPRAL